MQLIDANAKMIDKYFNKKLIDVRDCPCGGCPVNPCGHPAKCVKFALWLNKTVDAVPVVHGQWVAVPSSDMMTGKAYKCSECNKMRYGSFMPNYCQNCGAKMDGDGNV